MARRTSVTETPFASGSSSYTVTLGPHSTGDLLLVCISNDNGGTTIVPNAAAVTAGWTAIGTQAQYANTRQVWFSVVATSSSMANPTFTVATNGTTGTCLVCDNHNNIGGVMRSDWSGNSASSNTVAYSSAGGTTVITPAADSLLIYSWNCDGSGNYLRTKLSDLICDSKRAYTTTSANPVSHIIGHTQLGSASCPDITMYAETAAEGGNGWVIEIKNATNGILQKQARADITELGGGANWYGNMGVQHSPVTWYKPSTFLAAAGGVQTVTINGASVTLSDTTLATPTQVLNAADSLWGSQTAIVNADNAKVLAGAWHSITAANLDGKIFSFLWANSVVSTSGRINTEGIIVGFASSDGNYALYQVCTKDIGWFAAEFKLAIIDLNNATLLASGSTGAGIDWTAITRIAYFWHRDSGSATSDILYVKLATILNSVAITGGSVDDEANFQVAPTDLTTWGHKQISDLKASAQITLKFPTQIGDGGDHETYFDSSASSAEFERGYSTTQKAWNINPNRVSISIKAGADDTIIMAAGVAASETPQLLSIHPDSDLGATYSFIGESIVGYGVTDNAGLPWSNTTFKKGDTVVIAGGGDLTNCVILKPTSSSAAVSITENGTVLANTLISRAKNGGGYSDYHVSLGSAVTSTTWNATTLSDGTPEIYSELTSGELVITLDGTGTSLVSSDVTFVGGSTAFATIAAPTVNQSVVLTGLSTTCRIQLYDASASAPIGSRILYNGEPGTTSYTWTDPAVAVASRDIRLRITDYLGTTAKIMIERNIGTCGISSSDAAISFNNEFEEDTSYNTQAAALGYNGEDITDIEIDDGTDTVKFNFLAGGDYDARRIYMYMVYWLDTEEGINDDFVFCSPLDPVNLPMTGVLFENVTSPQEIITFINAYVYDATTGRAKDLIVGDGINFAPDHVVQVIATVGGVNIITGDIADVPTAAEIAAEVAANPETVTVSTLLALQQE